MTMCAVQNKKASHSRLKNESLFFESLKNIRNTISTTGEERKFFMASSIFFEIETLFDNKWKDFLLFCVILLKHVVKNLSLKIEIAFVFHSAGMSNVVTLCGMK